MQHDELVTLVSKTSDLMERFQRTCDTIAQAQQEQTRQLQWITKQLPGVVQQTAKDSLDHLPGLVMGKVQDGLERPVHDYQQRLLHAGSEIEKRFQTLADQISRLERLHRLLIWKVVGVTAMCFLLLLGGGIWLSMHYTRVIQDNQLNAQLLQAYNAADVTLCGKNQLCAKVDIKGQHYGEHGEYVHVMPR